MASKSSSPSPNNQRIRHRSHRHPLYETVLPHDIEYTCKACKTFGCEKSYGCNSCEFDLHEFCAKCPSRLHTHMHRHRLKLVERGGGRNSRYCDLCRDTVDGLYYTCRSCDFHVHPLCTQFPQTVEHPQHPSHLLTLELGRSSRCMVCDEKCNDWRYRCNTCRVDVHLQCVFYDDDDGVYSDDDQEEEDHGRLDHHDEDRYDDRDRYDYDRYDDDDDDYRGRYDYDRYDDDDDKDRYDDDDFYSDDGDDKDRYDDDDLYSDDDDKEEEEEDDDDDRYVPRRHAPKSQDDDDEDRYVPRRHARRLRSQDRFVSRTHARRSQDRYLPSRRSHSCPHSYTTKAVNRRRVKKIFLFAAKFAAQTLISSVIGVPLPLGF